MQCVPGNCIDAVWSTYLSLCLSMHESSLDSLHAHPLGQTQCVHQFVILILIIQMDVLLCIIMIINTITATIVLNNSFQKWLRILIWLIIPTNLQILPPVSYPFPETVK